MAEGLQSLLNPELLYLLKPVLSVVIPLFLFVIISLYIYFSLTLMLIAKKLNYNKPWLAWIPIIRRVIILQLGGFSWLWILLILIPVIGWLILFILIIISFWKIAERRNLSGWLALLLIIPIINLIILGILAWYEKDKKKILLITSAVLIIFIIIPVFLLISVSQAKAIILFPMIYNSAPSPPQLEFYKIGASHFIDPDIVKDYRELKKMGINSYMFPVEVSYINSEITYKSNNLFLSNWEGRTSFLINKAHKDKLNFIYHLSEIDWDLWESPEYQNPSQELIDKWLENYTKVVGEVAKFAEEVKADVLIISANPQMIRIEPDKTPYFYSVYEKFLREMLKEAKKYYKGEIGIDFGGTGGYTGSLLEAENPFIPEIGKIEYVFFFISAKPLDESNPYEWTNITLNALNDAKKIVEKNNAKGIILGYEYREKHLPILYGPCEFDITEEERINLYNDLIENTKDKVVGYVPITTPLYACDRENLLKVTKEWFEKL